MLLPAPVNVNVSLDYLLYMGQRRVEERQTLTGKLYRIEDDSALTKLKAGSAMSCYRNQNQVGTISRKATTCI